MAEVDIDPFSYHNKINSHPDATGETIPLSRGGAGGSSWEEEHEQEHHSEGKLKKEGSPIFTSTIFTRSYLSIMNKPRKIPITTTSNAKAIDFTSNASTSP